MKVKCDKDGIEMAIQVINEGGIIVFPTDTVYGIGCDPYNQKAVDRIYKIKSREKSNPLPVLVSSQEIASSIAEFDKNSKKLAEKHWPGPLTLILKLKDQKLQQSLEITEKIALRVPNNSCVLKLLEKCRFLVGTSANISGEEPFTEPVKCYQSLSNFELFLDGGKILGGVASTIAEIENGKLKIHREGILTKEELMKSI